jgi:hypothetical protein
VFVSAKNCENRNQSACGKGCQEFIAVQPIAGFPPRYHLRQYSCRWSKSLEKRDLFCSSRIAFYGIIAIVVTGKNLYKNNNVRSIPYPFFSQEDRGKIFICICQFRLKKEKFY